MFPPQPTVPDLDFDDTVLNNSANLEIWMLLLEQSSLNRKISLLNNLPFLPFISSTITHRKFLKEITNKSMHRI
jgi:hypothetical protein